MMRRFGLRDDQWERIKDLLPGREGSVGVTAADNRLFIEAVLYRYCTGMPWRDLPARFGDGIKVHLRFSRWATFSAADPATTNTSQPPADAVTSFIMPELRSRSCRSHDQLFSRHAVS